jgi:hypothetical protein
MSVELSISGALPFKRCPKVNIRIISLALHMIITIEILLSHPFLRTKIGCITDSCAPQETVAHIS